MSSQKMYKEAVLEHYRNPRNYGELEDPDVYVREDNPLCGDEVALYFSFDEARIVKEVRFTGRGCAISLASASMLTERIRGMSLDALGQIDEKMVLDDLGIEISPMRIKCATLALHVLRQGTALYEGGAAKRPQERAEEPRRDLPTRHALLDHIGTTPLIRLDSEAWGLAPQLRLFAKLEAMNAGGTIKARSILAMVRNAIKSNQAPLLPGMTILDSVHGSSGIAMAMIGAAMRFPIKLIAPAGIADAARALIRAYGAQLVVLREDATLDGAAAVAKDTYKRDPARHCYLDMYNNPSGWSAHYATTGAEIVAQAGAELTHFVAGVGSGATITGIARRLKEHHPAVQIHGVVPASPADRIEGLRHPETGDKPAIFDPAVLHHTISISAKDADDHCRQLAKKEGLLVGASSGAALAASLRLARTLERGTVVTVFPDDGQRYLGQPHWLDDY